MADRPADRAGALFSHLPAGRVAILATLMLASALTEGAGIVLLVPMLSLLADGGDAGAGLGGLPGQIGVPLSLGPLLVLFVALAVLRAAINHARTIASHRLEVGLVDGLRARAWAALLHCDWRVLSAMRQSDNASLLVNNVDRVGYGLNQALAGLAAAVTLGGLGLAALAISPAIALGAGLGGAAVLAAYRSMRSRAGHLGDELGKAYGEIHANLAESLGALRVIKSFGREDEAARRGQSALARLRGLQYAFLRDQGWAQIALQGGGAGLLAVLVWLALERWGVAVEQVLPLVALFARALPLLGAVQQAWQSWAHERPALAETMALIARAEAAGEPDDAGDRPPPTLAGAITFEAVTVHYQGRERPALAAASIAIPARRITLLSGPSGAGKSTVADLLGGLIEPDAGTVRIDGVPLAGALRRAWRGQVAYVQQEPVLFSGTVRDNLLWAMPQVSEARLHEVLRAASATFVERLPDGLDTSVGEGGRRLSGGERQRIVLARALLREPALLILDEAASALDAENEVAIAQAISRLRDAMTVVVIGHRGALAALADHVIELRDGGVVAAPPLESERAS